jgi:hypothetical protein
MEELHWGSQGWKLVQTQMMMMMMMVMVMVMAVFWVVVLCSFLKVDHCFRDATCRVML